VKAIAAVALVLFAMCEEEGPPPVGAVRIHTTITGATLYVDATERSTLHDGMEVQLTPGPHVLEARRDGRILANVPVEARSALIYDVTLADETSSSPPPMAAPMAPIPPPAEPPSSAGALAADQVRTVIQGGQPAIRSCYEEHPVPGTVRIDVNLNIAPDGSVSSATASGGDEAAGPLRACIEERVRALRFPAASDTTSVTFPFVFTATEDAPSTGSPSTPSRADVVAAMNEVAPAVSRCGGGFDGIANTRVVFSGPTGRATSAHVQGGNLDARTGQCIEEAVRAARVPPFSQSTFSVTYPFRY
jgi:hypothetical protein